MLAIKLQRIGKKHQPSYRLVVAEKRSKLGAPPVEDLGFYNPSTKGMVVKAERVDYWMKNGAQPTVSVHNLLVKNAIIKAAKLAVKMKKAEAKPVAAEVSTSVEVKVEAKDVPVSAEGGEGVPTSENVEKDAVPAEATK